jgi:hypothetical protein
LVSEVVDVTEISAVVAAAGVLVGVAYYVLDMRNQTRLRHIDLVMRLYSVFATEEFQKELLTLMTDTETKDYNAFRKKYAVNVSPTGLFFQEVGILLARKLADIDLICSLFGVIAMRFWEKQKLIVEDARKQLNAPEFGGGAEYLYNELKKREQKLQTGVKNG